MAHQNNITSRTKQCRICLYYMNVPNNATVSQTARKKQIQKYTHANTHTHTNTYKTQNMHWFLFAAIADISVLFLRRHIHQFATVNQFLPQNK